jgi:hypothetical protein
MFKRTLLLIAVLIGAPAVNANETNPHMQAITQQLKHLIDQANSTGFTVAFDKNITKQTQQWLITQENAADCTNTLLSCAQEKRDALQQKYVTLTDSSKNYTSLAKGIGQCHLGLCCGLGAILSTAMYAVLIMEHKLNIPHKIYCDGINEAVKKIKKTIIGAPSLIIPIPVALYDDMDFTDHELTATAAWLIPTLLACLSTKYLTRYGAKTLKQGWNYKKHLETQIKNLDEIIEYIQTCPFAPKIEEQI